MNDMMAFADRFFEAVSTQDMETVDRLYRDDVKVWHNWDDAEQGKEENLRTLGSIPDRYDAFDYIDARCVEVEDGFLRQHVIRAQRGGKTALVPAILRVYVDDGQVYRIEEYFDQGQLTSALA